LGAASRPEGNIHWDYTARPVESGRHWCENSPVDLIDDIWLDAFVSLVAIIALPFYIGYLDSPFEDLLAYALVAGICLASGERLLYRYYRNDGVGEFVVNAVLRSGAVIIWGGVAFTLAIWLI
jgi:hypothetical protein